MSMVQRNHVQVWDKNGGRPGEWERKIPLNAGATSREEILLSL